jgi:Na+-driven multidrug efflux pump
VPAWGLANAASTLVGQNLGARKPERAEAAVRVATRFNMLFLGGVGIIFIIGSGLIARVFTSDPEVLLHASRALWIVSLAFPLYAAGMCLEGAFNGAGDTWTPTRLNFYCLWLGQVPVAWLLAEPMKLGPLGVFIAVPVAYSALALWSAVLFKLGGWKLQKV